MKCSPAWLQHILFDPQLVHGILVHDIDATPVVNQYLGELHINLRTNEGRINHQSITPRVRHHLRMIRKIPCDLSFRPIHEPRHRWHNSIYFHFSLAQALLVTGLGYKYHVTLVVLPVLISVWALILVIRLYNLIHCLRRVSCLVLSHLSFKCYTVSTS